MQINSIKSIIHSQKTEIVIKICNAKKGGGGIYQKYIPYKVRKKVTMGIIYVVDILINVKDILKKKNNSPRFDKLNFPSNFTAFDKET